MTSAPELFGMSAAHWTNLIKRIQAGRCVPIIGSQLLSGITPQREELARSWAAEIDPPYPLVQTSELSMVAEFENQENKHLDKNALLDSFRDFALAEQAQLSTAWLNDDAHPLRTLATLQFDTFLTTTYFDTIEQAITKFRPNAEPVPVACQWGPKDRDWTPAQELDHDFQPSFERPAVFHIHGHLAEPGSLVLTETDHMQFGDGLIPDLSQDRETPSFIPAWLRNELSNGTWFFLGYGAADRNLRALLRALGQQVQTTRAAVAVQLQSGEAITGREDIADEFLTAYFKKLLVGRPVEIVLHDVRDFLARVKEQAATE